MQFVCPTPGIEALGGVMELMLEGFKVVPSVAMRYFVKHGVLTASGESSRLRADGWYPIELWLRVFESIANEVGPNAMLGVGRSIGAMYPLPPSVRGVAASLEYVDIGYHLSHRRDGRVMFDQATGKMLEGIGHYLTRRRGEGEVICTCDTPYSCDFDFGVLTALATRLEPKARTVHDDRGSCRKRGDEVCIYHVSW